MSERNGALGAPKGNRNARKHGFHAAKKALSEFGQAAIDGRSALGRALADFRGEVGNPPGLNTHRLVSAISSTSASPSSKESAVKVST